MYEKLSLRYAKLARRYIGVKLSTGAIRHSKTRLAQTAGRGGARAAKLIMYTFSPEKVVLIHQVKKASIGAQRGAFILMLSTTSTLGANPILDDALFFP